MINPQVSIARPVPAEVIFKKVELVPPKRLILAVDGGAKSGKTHFCLTAPGPISVQDLDLGLEGVVEEFTREFPDKELYHFPFAIPYTASLPGSPFSAISENARKTWEDFVRTYRASLGKVRTNIVDTGSEAWALLRLARLGKLTQIMPIKYTEVNSEFRQLTQLALLNTETNVIYTHKLKAVYKNEQKTEETERSGFADIAYDVQAVVRTDRDLSKEGIQQFSVVIEECRLNFAATGKRFTGADCTFQNVAVAIFPSTTKEFWMK